MKFPFRWEKPDPLQALFAERLKATAAKAREAGGVEKADLEALESLARLSALVQTAAPRKTNPVLGGVLLALTMGVATFLFFGRIPSTEIETETSLTSVTFRLSEPTVIMGGWKVRSAGVSGFDKIALQDQSEAPAQADFNVEALASRDLPGSVSLASIDAPVNTVVTLEPSAKGYQLTLKLEKGARLQLQFDVLGSVRFSGKHHPAFLNDGQGSFVDDVPTSEATLKIPKTIHVSAEREVVLDLALPDGDEPAFSPLLPVDELQFMTVEQFGEGSTLKTRVLSSILSGTLYYEHLEGREQKLRENEEIHLSGLKGVLRSIRVKPGSLVVRFDGAVRGIVSGSKAHARNLMPSWLEFLKAQRPVALLWATGMYLFGVVMAGLKWLKNNA